jgi:WD40 repeat protein/serine/threonine protein kinase/Tfp pilus assembly protein PilF
VHNGVHNIDELFWEAVQRTPGEERDAYLARACGDDQALRQRVERLLQVQPNVEGFLERPFPGPSQLPTVDARPSEEPGTVIGPYKLLAQIGEGGMGLVFVAEQEQPIKRRVALKIIKPGMDSRQVIGRFEAERQALAMMDHPNIAKVLDAGTTTSGPYFVMELVKGTPITDYCDTHRLTTRQRLQLFIDVCHAVQHAHQKGIIHRDIKPSNVMVTVRDSTPVVKVIDFGIAKAIGGQLTDNTVFTNLAQMVGTPLYMSPEQAGLGGLDVDTRSDVYSLGVQLYELLTGTTPFDSEMLKKAGYDEMRRMIREQEPPRPSARLSTMQEAHISTIAEQRGLEPRRLSQHLRGELDWIVMKALEKDRNRRYETASAFAMDVQRYLADEPVAASPPSTVYRLRKFARRNRSRFAAAALALTTLLTIGVGLAWQQWERAATKKAVLEDLQEADLLHGQECWPDALQALDRATGRLAGGGQVSLRDRVERQRREVVLAARLKDTEREEQLARAAEAQEAKQRRAAEGERDTAQRRLYLVDMQLAQQAWEVGDIDRLHEILQAHRPTSGQSDLRGWEWYYLLASCHRALLSIKVTHTRIGSLVWSPDGRRLATSGLEDMTIKIWDATTGHEHVTLGGHSKHRVSGVAWSPAGGKLASFDYSGASVKIWDIANEQVERVLPGYRPFVQTVAWSNDGKRVAASGNGWIKVWDMATGKEVLGLDFVESGETFNPGPVVLSPDGNRLACGGNETSRNNVIAWQIRIWDLADGQLVTTLKSGSKTDVIRSLAWNADGKRLASVGESEGEIKVWDIAKGKEALALPGMSAVAWSPDGKYLAGPSSIHKRAIKVWDPTTGKEFITLRGHSDQVAFVAWSPDGRHLASTDQGSVLKVWDVTKVPEYDVLHGHSKGINCLAWSPRGQRLATAGADSSIKIWDLPRKREAHSITVKPTKGIPQLGRGALWMVAWSPDGQQLASTDMVVRLWKAATAEPIVTLSGSIRQNKSTNIARAVAWSPDGRHLASVNRDATIKIWDVVRKQEILTLGVGRYFRHLAWSPDGKWLAAGGSWGLIELWDTTTWEEAHPFPGHWKSVGSLAWSPDSRKLVTASDDSKIIVWDLLTRQALLTLRGHADRVVAVAWSMDGKRLASASKDSTIRIWDAVTGQQVLRLSAEARSVAWSPDGKCLASAGGDATVKLWDASAGYDVPERARPTTKPSARRESARIHHNLAVLLVDLKRFPEAEAAFRQASTLYESLVAGAPAALEYRREAAETLIELGSFLGKVGRHQEAQKAFRAALTYQVQMAGLPNDPFKNERAMTHYLLGRSLVRTDSLPQAAEQFHRVVELRPAYDPRSTASWEGAGNPDVLNALAWFFATCPAQQLREPALAVKLASKAVKYSEHTGAAENCNHWNTLGVAQYRAGDFRIAIASLEKAIALAKEGTSFDWFFLAMAHWQLGEKDRARELHVKAVDWMDKHKSGDEELCRLREESAALLGAPKPAEKQNEKY